MGVVAGTWGLLRRGATSMIASAGNRDAAQVAYYLVMSFPALLLLLVWAFSTLLDDHGVREQVVDAIVHALPIADPSDRDEVERLLDDLAAGAGGLGWLGAVALLYSASGAIGAFRHAVNDAWGQRDTRPFVPAKALDVGLTLVVAPVLIVALGLTLSGQGMVANRLLPLACLTALLTVLFVVLPATPSATLRAAWPGAVVAVVAIVAIELGAEAYFSVVGDSNAVYGTMGVLLALVFAAYLIALAVILGAHVSATADKPAEEPGESGAGLGRSIADALRGLFVRSRRA